MRSFCACLMAVVLAAVQILQAEQPVEKTFQAIQQIGAEGRHAEKVAALKAGQFDLFMIGDSITHTVGELGGKYDGLKEVWQRHYAPFHAINLGYNGARTENILWNLQNGELDGHLPKVAVMLIGTNDTDDRNFPTAHSPEEVLAGTKAIVDLIEKKSPDTKILILRIFPRGGDDEKGTGDNIFHASAKCVKAAHDAGALTEQLADGKRVFWLDIGHIFLRPDGTINTDLMPDLLHPNKAGAEAWAQAIEPTLAKLMGDKPINDPQTKQAAEYFQLRSGLANCKAQFQTEKTGRIAFVGGSITFNPGWRDELMSYFKKRFPETKFEFIASGIPSVGSVGHAFRLDDDVLSKGHMDLVFVEAAVNDHNYDGRADAVDLARRGMEGVVRQLRVKSPMTDVVEMHFVHDIDLAQWDAGKVPYTVAEHEKVAEYYGCPSLNLSKEVAQRIADKEFTWAGDFKGLHPSPFGQRIYASSMIRMLDAAFAADGAAKPHVAPEKPLDPQSFVNGRHGKLEDAKLVKGFALESKWKPATGQTRDGYTNCPAITTDAAGAEMTYTFDGTAFGLFLAAGHDTCIFEYSTDGAPFKDFDTWTQWSGGLYLPWPVVLESGLPAGSHTITIRTTEKAKGRQGLHIIHVLLN